MPENARTGIVRFASVAGLLLTGVIAFGPATAAQAGGRYHPAASSEQAGVTRLMAQAARGDAHAQTMLGFMYANGRGVPQSYDTAVDWYLRSAEQGDPDGQFLLGLMYDKGFGVNQDVVKAHKWLNLAASHASRQNRENYLRMRDAVASKMTPVQIDLAQKLAAAFVPAQPW